MADGSTGDGSSDSFELSNEENNCSTFCKRRTVSLFKIGPISFEYNAILCFWKSENRSPFPGENRRSIFTKNYSRFGFTQALPVVPQTETSDHRHRWSGRSRCVDNNKPPNVTSRTVTSCDPLRVESSTGRLYLLGREVNMETKSLLSRLWRQWRIFSTF
jgi:hypothetical protein